MSFVVLVCVHFLTVTDFFRIRIDHFFSRELSLKDWTRWRVVSRFRNLADFDKDGNLTCEEFCIAVYLVDQALAGRKLPTVLPPSLMPNTNVSLANFRLISFRQSLLTDRPVSTPIVDPEQKIEG